jgi:hypothetical protein
MEEHGNPPEPERARLREHDLGFAPMALTDSDPRYNRFSFRQNSSRISQRACR